MLRDKGAHELPAMLTTRHAGARCARRMSRFASIVESAACCLMLRGVARWRAYEYFLLRDFSSLC